MSREAAFFALFTTVKGSYPWIVASRRFRESNKIPAAMRPALFQIENVPETYDWTTPECPKRILGAKLFLYFDARDPTTPGATAINAALDAIDAFIHRRPIFGGAECRVVGVPVRDPGDLDGDGLAIVDVQLIMKGF